MIIFGTYLLSDDPEVESDSSVQIHLPSYLLPDILLLVMHLNYYVCTIKLQLGPLH